MSQEQRYIIERIESKNKFMALCFFKDEVYNQLNEQQEVQPVERVLMDSDHKQLIYVIEIDGQWQYIRFPLSLWRTIDGVLVGEQDVFLVLSVTEDGSPYRSIPLKKFHDECVELIRNMRGNANYGEDMADLVEEHFSQTISTLLS
ncbi:hypothetical protein J2S00_002533 [Caldalkalibacillus uzonensis]|uniref:IDEAL domain-containing protein n=1 Tax=Caldalkalibacillus uzonensis TaxID=353224 RepID=A0ABU0CTN8_9BACI|nr:hypothetical protein [Caldalkalibacillus uzonensis]MDQ0339740.1 hypothetical protein [Caldalkalibacillus uzonensis]